MIFVEPEVDCFRLRLRDVQVPVEVLQQKSGAIATASSLSVDPLRSTTPSDALPVPPIDLAERAEVLHRALLSSLYTRFPYESPDTLVYAHVLVVTHYAPPSLACQPLSAEEMRLLSTHYDFLPAELRGRTFPSHLGSILEPAWVMEQAATTAAGEQEVQKATEPVGPPPRPSIRVTSGFASPAKPAPEGEGNEQTKKITDCSLGTQMAPHFYDSFYLLAQNLTPAQQRLFYETQCRVGRPRAVTRASSLSSSPIPTSGATLPGNNERMKGGRTANGNGQQSNTTITSSSGTNTATFAVLQGRFTHTVPADTQTVASSSPLATAKSASGFSAMQRLSGDGFRRVVGESATYVLPSASPSKTSSPSPTSASLSSSAAAADARCLHFSVYRIPLTRFSPEDQQYCTNQREDLRWRQRRQCRAAWQMTCTDGQGDKGMTEVVASAAGLRCNDHDNVCTSSDSGTSSDSEEGDEGGVGRAQPTQSRRAQGQFTGALRSLVEQEKGTAIPRARRVAHFFETCHQILTNYVTAHTVSEGVTESTAPSTSTETGNDLPTTNGTSRHTPCLTTRYPGISYLGVSRLLYSLAPCDCYHLIMKDANPLYYAQSVRASSQAQTIPLSLVADLCPERARAVVREGGNGRSVGGSSQSVQDHNSSPRATATARTTRASTNAMNRATVLRSTTTTTTTSDCNNAARLSLPRPSPLPGVSGQVLWIDAAPTDEKTDKQRDSTQERKSDSSSGERKGGVEAGLVRSRPVSRAPSPERASGSPRGSTTATRASHQPAWNRPSGKPSRAEGILRVTASLVSNSISGNPKHVQRSLADTAAQVPDFLQPDHARRRTGCGSSSTTVAAAAASAASSSALRTAAVNLFQAIATSSLAQQKLRGGSIRPVVSVAVLDSTERLSSGITGHTTRSDDVHSASDIPAPLRESADYCCRGLVDHTWLTVPVQRTPAEQESIQWMPVLLGSTDCASDVGLRTAVHLGVFPRLEKATSTSRAGREDDGVSSVGGKSGVVPTRDGAMSSLSPSTRPAGDTKVTGSIVAAAAAPRGESRGSGASSAPALQIREVNQCDSPSSALKMATDVKANTYGCSSIGATAPRREAYGRHTDAEGYAIPARTVQRRGGMAFQLSTDPMDNSSHSTETLGAQAFPRTQPSTPRYTADTRQPPPESSFPARHAATGGKPAAATETVQMTSMQRARGGVAMTFDLHSPPAAPHNACALRGTSLTTSASHRGGVGGASPLVSFAPTVWPGSTDDHGTGGFPFSREATRHHADEEREDDTSLETSQRGRKAINWADRSVPRRPTSPRARRPESRAMRWSGAETTAVRRPRDAMHNDWVQSVDVEASPISCCSSSSSSRGSALDWQDEFLGDHSSARQDAAWTFAEEDMAETRRAVAAEARPLPAWRPRAESPPAFRSSFPKKAPRGESEAARWSSFNPFFGKGCTPISSAAAVPHTPPRHSPMPACFGSFRASRPTTMVAPNANFFRGGGITPSPLTRNVFLDDPAGMGASGGGSTLSPRTPTPRAARRLATEERVSSRPYPSITGTQSACMRTGTLVNAAGTAAGRWEGGWHRAGSSPSLVNCSLSALSQNSSEGPSNAWERGNNDLSRPTSMAAPQRVPPLWTTKPIACPGATTTQSSLSTARFAARTGTPTSTRPFEWPETSRSTGMESGTGDHVARGGGTRQSAAPNTGRDAPPFQLHTPPHRPTSHTFPDGRTSCFGGVGGHRSPGSYTSPPICRTLGVGGLNALDAPPPTRRQQASTRHPLPSSSTAATYLSRYGGRCIDEYDDEAVLRAKRCGVTGPRARVRPRGVGAMDPAWWQPVTSLSSAPNLRCSSTVLGTASQRREERGGDWTASVTDGGRRSMNVRLSAFTEQPYHVQEGGEEDVEWGRSAADRFDSSASVHGTARWTRGLSLDPISFGRAADPSPSLAPVNSATTAALRTAGRLPFHPDHDHATASDSRRTHLSYHPVTQPLELEGSTPGNRSSTDLLGPRRRLPQPLLNQAPRWCTVAQRGYGARTTRLLPYDVTVSREAAERRRRAQQRQRRLDHYQEQLRDNYMCGPMPKRYCFERPPLHPTAPPSLTVSDCGIHVLGTDTVGTRGRTAMEHPPWAPRTSTVPPPTVTFFPDGNYTNSSNRSLAAAAVAAAIPPSPLLDASRTFSLGGAPPTTEPLFTAGVGHNTAASTLPSAATQRADAALRARAAEAQRDQVRKQMQALLEPSGAGVHVSFTLRDIAAVFLRLPGTHVRSHNAIATGSAAATTVEASKGSGLEVLDICTAARRIDGLSCFLSQPPNRLRGGWQAYIERINRYQEPFYLREQAFILLLPVPHAPGLRVCVAVHSINDLLSLICQTAVSPVLPSAEEVWMRQRNASWSADQAEGDSGIDGGGTTGVVEEERRWCFGLFTTRKVLPTTKSTTINGHRMSVGQPAIPPESEETRRRKACQVLHRQHHLDGLCLTSRHRLRIWWSFFTAGRTCTSLPASTSPLLTNPELAKARCALLCDRIAAYAMARHRLETLRAVREAYVQRRAEQLAKDRVLKLCDRPHWQRGIELGRRGPTASDATQTSPSPFTNLDAASAGKGSVQNGRGGGGGRNGGGVAFTVDMTSSEAPGWANRGAARPPPSRSHFQMGDIWTHQWMPPSPPHAPSVHRPGMTRAMRLRTEANRRVASGEQPAASLRHANGYLPTKAEEGPFTLYGRRAAMVPLGSSDLSRGRDGVCRGEEWTCWSPSGAAPASHLFSSPSSTVAPYASGASLAPSYVSSTGGTTVDGLRYREEDNASMRYNRHRPASSAQQAAEACAVLDHYLDVDRDDAIAGALLRLTQRRDTLLSPPLLTALAVVPLAAQDARGAGGGVTEALGTWQNDAPVQSDLPTSSLRSQDPVPTPVEVQQRSLQSFAISVAQTQQLLQWQWEHHQHRYTLWPQPLMCGSVAPSVDLETFTSTNPFSSYDGAVQSTASVITEVSPLARTLLLHLLRWSWLLPSPSASDGGDASTGVLWCFQWCLSSERGKGGRRIALRVRRYRLLVVLVMIALACEYPSRVFFVLLTLSVAFFALIPFGSIGGGDESWRPRLLLFVGPRLHLPSFLFRSSSAKVVHRERRRYPFSPYPLSSSSSSLANQIPPSSSGLSLLCSLADVTTQAVRERRHPLALEQAAVAQVLQWQAAGAVLLSRLQLFVRGYSTVASLWIAVLCLSYLLLYLGYNAVLHQLPCGDGSYGVVGGLALVDGGLDKREGGTVRLVFHQVTSSLTHSFDKRTSANADAEDASMTAESPLSLLRSMSGVAWQEVLEPVRFLLLQQLHRVADGVVEARPAWDTEAVPSGSESSGDGENKEDQFEDSTEEGEKTEDAPPEPARPSHFYQNGRYYTYDAQPPPWVRAAAAATAPAPAKSAVADNTVKPPVDVTAFDLPVKDASTAMHKASLPSSPGTTTTSARLVTSLSEWLASALRSEVMAQQEKVAETAASTEVGAITADNASSAPVASMEKNENSRVDTNAIRDEPTPSLRTPDRVTACTEPGLMWFILVAYAATLCLPHSPLLWLWRRVWGVVTHDDALTRRPVLSV